MNPLTENTIKINATTYNLTSLEQLAWKKLVNGAVKKKNGFRNVCVGTIGANNEASLRIVVNRKVDETSKTIYFHTDIRSRKFIDIQKNNTISLLFYDPKQKTQIVVKANAAIHHNNNLANNRWQATSPQARLGYMTIDAPNTKSDEPTLGYEHRFSTIKPTEIESAQYSNNFAVIACEVFELEFLYLDYLGNRKANFYYKEGVLQDCFWAVP